MKRWKDKEHEEGLKNLILGYLHMYIESLLNSYVVWRKELV